VAFRRAFHEGLPEALKDTIEMYQPDRYIASAGLLDNMLFGRITQKYRDGADRIYATVGALLSSLGLRERVLEIGLDFHVGTGGKRLTSVQRQRLALARAVLRRSSYYVFNRPLTTLDPRAQDQTVRQVLEFLAARDDPAGVVWVLSSAAQAPLFDRIVVFEKGRIAEEGTHATLSQKGGIFREMVSA
jgi:putative ABC transport system ATP-binding protein